MSVKPTSIARAGAVCAVAAGLMVPAGAVAAKPDKPQRSGTPAVCDHALPPGIAKKDGDLPPGIAKKAAGQPPCKDNPQGHPSDGRAGAGAAAPAPAAAVTTSASSQSARRCVTRRAFRLRLDRKGRVRKARVMLNGRAIPVTRGRKRTTVLIDLRGRRAGTYVVRTTVLTRKGKLHTSTRRYRVCA